MTGTANLSILAKHFSDENAARQLLEKMRWPNGVVCPRCGGDDPYRIKAKASGKNPARQGLFCCRACRKQFSSTTGTIFESSHVPVSKWLLAIHLISASKKGLSAHQLHRMIGVSYRSAWFMNHRLRHAMSDNATMPYLAGVVEGDECYIGGRRRIGPTNAADRTAVRLGRPGPNDKKLTPVVGLVERRGRLALFPVQRTDSKTLQTEIRKRVNLTAHMVTDELNSYDGLSMGFASHRTIKHTKKEYVRGDVHTNTIEGVFSLLKRSIIGVFHHVSKGHLHRYCDEAMFKYNTRTALGYTDNDRAAVLVAATEGKRLTYR